MLKDKMSTIPEKLEEFCTNQKNKMEGLDFSDEESFNEYLA